MKNYFGAKIFEKEHLPVVATAIAMLLAIMIAIVFRLPRVDFHSIKSVTKIRHFGLSLFGNHRCLDKNTIRLHASGSIFYADILTRSGEAPSSDKSSAQLPMGGGGASYS